MHCDSPASTGRAASQRLRWRSKLLLVAILPALTFFGHWPVITFHVPGAALDLTVPFVSEDAAHEQPAGTTGGPTAGSSSDAHEHTQHCHADAASCTDVPFTGASAFGLLNDTVAFLGAGALLMLMIATAWRPGQAASVGPDLRPPRASLLPA